MEMPINVIIVLVIMLVLVAVLLILLSRGGNFLSDLGGEKIDTAGGASECETLCFKCCRGDGNICDSYSPTDVPHTHPDQNCGCFGDGTGC